MSISDFCYDGIYLSDYKWMIGGFDNTSFGQSIQTDSQRTFNNISLMHGKYMPFSSTPFNNALVMTFQIMKNPCSFDDLYLTRDQVAEMKHWLNRPKAHKFQIYDGMYWEGSFNVTEIVGNGHCVGLELEFTATAPFGFKEFSQIEGDLAANGTFKVEDISDDAGSLFPTLVITCTSAGDLKIMNSLNEKTTLVKNCQANETITFTAQEQILTDSTTHNIMDDFNFIFPQVCNDYRNNQNVYTITLPCHYTFSYKPIAKVVFEL